MAGGIGSRFWPKSRNHFPKQFLDILGTGRSLLQITYNRFLKICPPENIFIVTNSQYSSIILEQLEGIDKNQLICEPSRNNTAPCIAYASFKIAALDPEANLIVAPSDHFILFEEVFVERLRFALDFSNKNDALVTLGISPIRPDTGYGYIQYDKEVEDGIYKVERFREKPTLQKAKEYLASGNFLWNAGIFIWKAKAILNALKKYTPEIHDLFESGKEHYNRPGEQNFIDNHYASSPSISIDYAIMEQADNIYTIPSNFGWSDLGTWNSLYEVADKDAMNNVVSAQQINIKGTQNSIIHINSDKLAVIRGLDNFIVVDDGNALLIYPKDQEQEIKDEVKQLTEKFGNRFI